MGSKVRLNGIDFTVLGVAPEAFTGIDQFVRPSLFVPIAMEPTLTGTENLKKRDARWLVIKGRLKPGVSRAGAQEDLNAIAKVLEQMYPKEPRRERIRV